MVILGELNQNSPNGIYKVRTESGSEYRVTVDEGQGYMQREPGENSGSLRRDGEPISLLKTVDLQVHKSGVFVLECLGQGAATVRITTPVKVIERVG